MKKAMCRNYSAEHLRIPGKFAMVLLAFLTALSACSGQGVWGNIGAAEPPVNQATEVAAENTAAPTDEPTPAATSAPTLPPTAKASPVPTKVPAEVSTQTPPPTPEFTYEARENPYVVEDGIVKIYVYDEATNQEILIDDPTFPYTQLEELAKKEHMTIKIGEITKDGVGNFTARDLNYGHEDGKPGTLRAINTVGGEWQASHLFNAAVYLPENEDAETMIPLEFGLPPGFTIDDAQARNFRHEFFQKLLNLNMGLFTSFTQGSGASWENVLSRAREIGGTIPFHVDGSQQDLIMPARGRHDSMYITLDPKRASVNQGINVDKPIGVLIYNPDTFINDARIEAFLQSANIRHTLVNGDPGISHTTGMVLVGDRLVFIHGTEWEYAYDIAGGADPYFEDVSWWTLPPEEATKIIAAFSQGYLEAFDLIYEDEMFAPLYLKYTPTDGNVCTGSPACDPVNPDLQFIQAVTQ